MDSWQGTCLSSCIFLVRLWILWKFYLSNYLILFWRKVTRLLLERARICKDMLCFSTIGKKKKSLMADLKGADLLQWLMLHGFTDTVLPFKRHSPTTAFKKVSKFIFINHYYILWYIPFWIIALIISTESLEWINMKMNTFYNTWCYACLLFLQKLMHTQVPPTQQVDHLAVTFM